MTTRKQLIKWLIDQERKGKAPVTWTLEEYGDGEETIIRFHTEN